MPRVQPLLSNFSAGEIGARLWGRADQARYYNGCRVLENMFVWPQGPAERRPGTRFIAEVKSPDTKVRLIPFEYSTEQAYVVEAGAGYFRFYKDGGRIESPPGSPVEIVTPYLEAHLARLKWCQSADVLYLFHPDLATRKLARLSHTSWTLTEVAWIDGPYLEQNLDPARTLTPSATTGAGIAITATGHGPFVATDVGRLVRIKHGAGWGHARITAVVSASQVTADVVVAFGAATASADWRLGLWSDTTGWPACGTFHEERLVMGGARARPQRIDGSRANDFETFTPGTDDADAFAYSIGANQVAAILWLESWRQLIVGTPSGEFRVGTESAQQGLTPTNTFVRRETRAGCADLAPQAVGAELMFVQRQGRKVRALGYKFEADGYEADDLTLWADHVTAGGVVAMVYQQEPASILWCARADGVLLGCTVMTKQQVLAWHRHPLGGGAVEALAVIPSSTAHDELWLVVRRTIGGVTRRSIERLEPPLADDATPADAWYVDAGLAWDGAPATVFAGLSHLEGETVQILADGAVHPPRLVAGGSITLDRPASRVTAGLGYTSTLVTMPLEVGSPQDTGQGRRRRVNRIVVRLLRTLGCRLGAGGARLDEVPFRAGGQAMDAPPPLFSGDKRLTVEGGYEDPVCWVTQDQPLPLAVVAIVPQVAAYD
jgi:hypothetical protein